MNARQKAKKYKRLYESLLKNPIHFVSEPRRICRLKFQRLYQREIIEKNSDIIQELIVDDVVKEFRNNINKYCKFHIERDFYQELWRLYGEIDIVEVRN